MAEIISRKNNKHALRVDLTSMVDLGFLLITFFVVTTSLTQAKALKNNLPAEGNTSKSAESKTVSMILANNNKVLLYFGNDSLHSTAYSFNNLTTLRNAIITRQNYVQQRFGNKKELVLLIKPTTNAVYRNVVDALDEALINGIAKYMVVNASAFEEKMQ